MAGINTFLTPPPSDAPNRRDKTTFKDRMYNFFVWMTTIVPQLISWTAEVNAFLSGIDNSEPTEVWNYGTSYSFPQVVAGADGVTYRAGLDTITGLCPHSFNRVAMSATVSFFYVYTVYATTAHANKTYTFRVSMWLETIVGQVRLFIKDGAGTVLLYEDKTVTQGVNVFSVTGTFGASPAADIVVVIDPLNTTGSIGDSIAVYGVWLAENTAPNTNLLTGTDKFDTDITDWLKSNATITLIAASAEWQLATGQIATNAEMIAGTEAKKLATAAGVKVVTDALLASSGRPLLITSASSSNEVTTSSTSWQTKADPAPSIIIPKTNCKIKITVSTLVMSTVGSTGIFDLRREVSGGASTDNISGETNGLQRATCNANSSADVYKPIHYTYVDAPGLVAGTSITYKINYKSASPNSIKVSSDTTLTTITLEAISE
ncbi:MAG: hypothetical protein HGB35_01960 [Geobacteraceae bacterium]|nr:hypothetical protein [Geobacteraceae bacterium]